MNAKERRRQIRAEFQKFAESHGGQATQDEFGLHFIREVLKEDDELKRFAHEAMWNAIRRALDPDLEAEVDDKVELVAYVHEKDGRRVSSWRIPALKKADAMASPEVDVSSADQTGPIIGVSGPTGERAREPARDGTTERVRAAEKFVAGRGAVPIQEVGHFLRRGHSDVYALVGRGELRLVGPDRVAADSLVEFHAKSDEQEAETAKEPGA